MESRSPWRETSPRIGPGVSQNRGDASRAVFRGDVTVGDSKEVYGVEEREMRKERGAHTIERLAGCLDGLGGTRS